MRSDGQFCECDALIIGGGPAGSTAFARFEREMKHGSREFSWFIYRITTPTMRDLFMDPSNRARMKEALLSVLAGDIFGKTPIWRAVFAFKLVYYIAATLKLKRSLAAWARRKKNILPVDDVQTDFAK